MATARHPKATFFVQRHLFSGLTSFAELEQKIAALPDEQSRGAAFEVFAEAYLATQRKYDAAQVWPHDSVPLDILKNLGLTQQDQDVDGVLQTLLGQFNAYQIKFRTGRPVMACGTGNARLPPILSVCYAPAWPLAMSALTKSLFAAAFQSGLTLCFLKILRGTLPARKLKNQRESNENGQICGFTTRNINSCWRAK
jgi:hypothetical protein